MNEVAMTIEAFYYQHNWRGIDDVTIIEVEGTILVKIARRWIDVSKIIISETTTQNISLN